VPVLNTTPSAGGTELPPETEGLGRELVAGGGGGLAGG
jgi:hypothetical protein